MLEAGSKDYKNKFIKIPAGILRLFKSKFDWQHETTGEKACNGRNIFLARGKVLGGSSCTNVLLHHRGSKADYDNWKVDGWKGACAYAYAYAYGHSLRFIAAPIFLFSSVLFSSSLLFSSFVNVKRMHSSAQHHANMRTDDSI